MSLYGANDDRCDCNCGTADPDCDLPEATINGCDGLCYGTSQQEGPFSAAPTFPPVDLSIVVDTPAPSDLPGASHSATISLPLVVGFLFIFC